MIQPLLEFYNLLESNSNKFTEAGLAPFAFFDIYRSQPLEPELHEYFPLPAIFIDYTMAGQGIKQPRLVTLTLHIITGEMPDASNISNQKTDGLKMFMYNLIVQKILEGSKLGATTALRFVNEQIVDAPVINYHTQTYQFETYISDMMHEISNVIATFERLNIFGNVQSKP